MSRKPVAVVFYGYSKKNSGDMAITLGAVDFLLSKGFSVRLVSRYEYGSSQFQDSYNYIDKYYGDQVDIVGCPFRLDRSASKFKQIYNYLFSFLVLLGVVRPKSLYDSIFHADIVFFNGGNLFRSTSLADSIRLLALAKPLWLAKNKGKKYIVLPQSSTKLKGIGYYVVKSIVEGSKANFVRESMSLQYLSRQYPDVSFKKCCDLAFLINSRNDYLSERKRLVSFTVRGTTVGDLAQFEDGDKEKIKKRITMYADKCIDHGFDVRLVSQTLVDTNFTKQCAEHIQRSLGYCPEVVFCDDVFELKEIYRSSSLLIGMRLHSMILAISEGTPCFGLFSESWGLKNPGVLSDFGLKYEFIDNLSSNIDEEISGFPETYIQNNSELRVRNKELIRQQSSELIDMIDNELERFYAEN
ncbi:MAG: polysaccharide pyruvyl transferase family protein [Pseudomonadota bacterium]